MPQAVTTVSVRSDRINVEFPATELPEFFSEHVIAKALAFQQAFQAAFTLEFRRIVIPRLEARTAVRTGRLRDSIRFRPVANGFTVTAAFYGAYLNPSHRQLLNDIFNRNKQTLIDRATVAARAAIQ